MLLPVALLSLPLIASCCDVGAFVRDDIAEIKRAVDIAALMGEYFQLESAGGNAFKCLCPFHDDHKPSMIVNTKFQNYKCWSCGAHGDIFTFLQEYERINFVEAKQRLADRAGIKLGNVNPAVIDARMQLHAALNWAKDQFFQVLCDERQGAEARQYLKERGLTWETATKYGLGMAPRQYDWLIGLSKKTGFSINVLVAAGLVKPGTKAEGTYYDAFRGRLMFPIRDERGKIVGFGGRMLPGETAPDAPKYINTAATDVYHKSKVLYGLEVASEALTGKGVAKGQRTLAVMEGYTDCLMAWQFGYLTAVATCGTALTPLHVAKLGTYADKVVLMFDGDAAGQKAARQAIELFLLSEGDVRVCILPDNQDPCDFLLAEGVEALRQRIESAPDALQFLIEGVRKSSDTSVEGKRQALENVLRSLAMVPSSPREQLAIKFNLSVNRLASLFGAEEAVIRRRIEELRKQSRSAPRNGLVLDSEVEVDPATIPMDQRARLIVQLMVVDPKFSPDILHLWPPDSFKHPHLRALAEACREICMQHGASVSVEVLRAQLNDSDLDALVVELLDTAPTGEHYQAAVEDVKRWHADWKRRSRPNEVRQALDAAAGPEAHLEVLRKIASGTRELRTADCGLRNEGERQLAEPGA